VYQASLFECWIASCIPGWIKLSRHVRSKHPPTQCGFRKGHGTLDALFTLQHCIKRTRWHRKRVYAVFVDFRKAFDTVRRDLMIERCKQLGCTASF
jgi:hypothetical protein